MLIQVTYLGVEKEMRRGDVVTDCRKGSGCRPLPSLLGQPAHWKYHTLGTVPVSFHCFYLLGNHVLYKSLVISLGTRVVPIC